MAPGKRVATRSRLERLRVRLREARFAEPERRAAVFGDALKELLALAGSVGATETVPEAEAVKRGAERVGAALKCDPLAATLAEFLQGRDPPARDSDALDRLFRLCQWTDWLIDLQSERERRLRRGLARGTIVLALAFAVHAVFGDRNLARDRPILASSIGGYTPAPLPGKPRLSRLVDGVTVERAQIGVEWAHGLYAGGTEGQVHPWLTVDLGETRTLSTVVVYNRSDCCWGLRDVPVQLQLSDNNHTFVTVATREQPFSDDFPWRQPVHGARARFVRLWGPTETTKELVLSEIEIYGH